MKKRKLGRDGLTVSAMGLGCMGMSEFYGPTDEAESLATFAAALDAGIDFFDTADMYGEGANEELVGKALRGRRTDVVVATKFGIVRDRQDPRRRGVNGKPQYVKASCDQSLARLGFEVIDLYYLHRVDPDTPIEDTVGAMADLVKAGKVRHLGLSEVSADTLRRADRVHPIAAVQSEYSLWTRDPEESGVLAACRELGVGIVPYSPLGRGFLAGKIKAADQLPPGDFRRQNPRFAQENLPKNLELLQRVEQLADEKGCSPAQLALAWVLAQGEDVVPIPGTKRRKYLEENLGALAVRLLPEDLRLLGQLGAMTAGDRYPPVGMTTVNR
jgi:aryl-alcohol dehydrogenase-like predicted oxidoreductase